MTWCIGWLLVWLLCGSPAFAADSAWIVALVAAIVVDEWHHIIHTLWRGNALKLLNKSKDIMIDLQGKNEKLENEKRLGL